MSDKLLKQISYYKYGSMGILVNILIALVYVVTLCYLIYCYLSDDSGLFVKFILILSVLTIASITTVAILLSPKGYELTNTELILIRVYKPIHIPLDEIMFIETVDHKPLKNSIRLLGSSGFCGYWGKFKSPQYGIFYVHAKEIKHMFFIRCNNGKQYLFQGNDEISRERFSVFKKDHN